MKHIFVLAMDELQRAEVETVCAADHCYFHSVMDVNSLVDAENIRFDDLLDEARSSIKAAGVSVDGIIAHWDFPTSVLVPILCKEFGVPTPSLESVLKCEHKYWSRLEQASYVPDMVPDFCAFDPFSELPLAEIHLDFPFWIKPVKGFSSQLGFLIRNETEFYNALEEIRQGIGRLGGAFNEVLTRVRLPPAIEMIGANACLAEEIITGVQIAPEGYVQDGKVHIQGFFDMHKAEKGTKINRLVYPSEAPDYIQGKMKKTCEELLSGIGFDNGCFNIEFMWDQSWNRLRIIEVNTRISQSHSEMFVLVDGRSNHEVAVAVALGQPPQMPLGEGPYRVAAKCILTYPEDGVVTRIPEESDLAVLKQHFPYLRLKLDVQLGTRLGSMPNQDSYRFVLGEVYLGAADQKQLLERYNECVASLPIEISPLGMESPEDELQQQGVSHDDDRPVSSSGKDNREHIHTDV